MPAWSPWGLPLRLRLRRSPLRRERLHRVLDALVAAQLLRLRSLSCPFEKGQRAEEGVVESAGRPAFPLDVQVVEHLGRRGGEAGVALGEEPPPVGPPVCHSLLQSVSAKAPAAPQRRRALQATSCLPRRVREGQLRLQEDAKHLARPPLLRCVLGLFALRRVARLFLAPVEFAPPLGRQGNQVLRLSRLHDCGLRS